ncbi:MAG: NADH-quinone oxidoreductase subunit NuoF [Candidatus Omnitrophica bacterium]|nr:NADH-quinone oxidoreductase subunit NuoF [Candidatus Omnitrophota bacterium]
MEEIKKIVIVKDTDTGKDTEIMADKFLFGLRELNLEDKADVIRAGDVGIYNKGIVVKILPDNITYAHVTKEKIDLIIHKTIEKGEKIEELVYKEKERQCRIVLRNCGDIDPENIDDYINNQGYEALKKVLTSMNPEEVINTLKISGLRGRGGGGFPTSTKWNFARQQKEKIKYIICNGDEGDPGAYMDRSVLEGDPHSVIEGMVIGGYTIGAGKGYLYIRAKYPLAIERIDKALKQARERGFLGTNILGTKFSFDLEVRLGAGAFVCGEETALIASIEGKRGCPTPRPPYPSVSGLWGKPTVINNVETLANIPQILFKGGEWFASIGTETTKGTKVFALTGKVRNSGLIEVPMGTTLREIVYEIGGGVLNNKKFKAVQTGGPSGGVIPEEFLDTKIDYESLHKLGSIMGSGGMIVMDEDDCMVDIAKFYLQFCVDESCGKCAPCRIGGKQMLDTLTLISKGEGTKEDLKKLKRISTGMSKASLCGLGQTAPNPVVSTMKYFEKEYIDHVELKKCEAKKCSTLFVFEIIEAKCKRCSLCQRHCPVKAIEGNREQGYKVIQEKCIKCGKCFEVCNFEAITR